MLDTETKRRIDNARDILVGKIPDPKSQIEQITIALIYKFMDDMDKKAVELGGKAKFFTGDYDKYSWSKLLDASVSGIELVNTYGESIASMNQNPNLPQLFRDIFKNAYLPYRDPQTLKSFLRIIDDFSYDHSERLGDAFEYLLSVMGSQGDAGQFRTPRHIIEFIVDVVNPTINDTIFDPACGTAGFLISAYKHILEKHIQNGKNSLTGSERKKLAENIVGYDISPDMVRLSLVNLYLHGFKNPKISEYDTLTSDDKWDEEFDVALANPPFMTPKGGIRPHKRFGVTSNRAEVLFVDYMAEHLNIDGRGGIVVPEGIIFQSGNSYKSLRKNLIETSLYAVVSLPAGVFNPYSGVKTSILFLDKKIAKKSKDILFVKVEADGYNLGAQRREIKDNDLPLALEILEHYQSKVLIGEKISLEKFEKVIGHIVPKDKIKDTDWNLSGDRYKEEVVYDGNWDLVKIEDLIEKVTYTTKIQKKEFKDKGKFPIIDQSDKFIAGYWNELKDVFYVKKPLVIFGDHTRNLKYVDFDFVLGADGVKILQPITKLSSKYFYYILKHLNIKSLGYSRHFKILKEIKIPLPPLEIQEKVVEEIENYQNIIDGAKKVVNSYKPSFKIDKNWDVVDFDNIIKIITPHTKIQKSEFKQKGKYPIIDQSQQMIAGYTDDKSRVLNIEKPVIIFGDHTCAVKYFENSFAQGADGIKILQTKDNLIPKLFYYYLLSNPIKSIGYNRHFSKLKLIKIPIPPLPIQKEIVARIEEEQKLVDSNKKLIELFEKKVKDKISEIWGN